DLLSYLHLNLNLLQRKGGSDRNPMYRVTLDPLADYLAALALIEELSGGGPDPNVDDSRSYQRVRDWLDLLDGRLQREPEEAGVLMRGFLAACRDGYRELLSRAPSCLDPQLRRNWDDILHTFARLAGIDPLEERKLEARHLIRRHAGDLFWSNLELLPKAIAELTGFAKEFPGSKELDQALIPLTRTVAKTTLPDQVRTAAAEALGHIGGEKAAKALIQMIESSKEREMAVRRAAAEALGLVEAPGDDPEAHWRLLEDILADKANHLDGDSFEAMDAKLPLLQGAARGLQRLATRCLAASCQRSPQWVWGAGPGLAVPMLTLTTSAGAVTTRIVEVPVWQVPLPGGVPLEVVKIPGGSFTLGSPKEEEGRDKYEHRPDTNRVEVEKKRDVTVTTFGMSRFPITQAQWNTLAGDEHKHEGGRTLNSNPSQHKGADLPVENVSWHDSFEWIERLNHWLKNYWQEWISDEEPPQLRLPSESFWEVACRAGATSPSPFHFGDTLDAAWANYNASYRYSGGRVGPYIQRPSPAGGYGLVNDWGLADLHGNIWEWCADVWNPSPLGVSRDGKDWDEQAARVLYMRLLRGGSWYSEPLYCRSACRGADHPDVLNGPVGFRVCCLPPGLPSWDLTP
ncbi:MAG: SUMF1/EgtB/PvdO family nonheme iron enzyme, partial [Cyanobacteriota bacterium]|nr:SUMF1/EgtB/PvdO family nonheme iron enzyme [Cyanobacteriota bacterium]